MNKNYVLLPILWYSDYAIELEEENEKNIKLGLSKQLEIPDSEIIEKEIAFFGFSLIIPHNYKGKDYCKIVSLTGLEFICTMTRDQALNKINYD